MVQAEILSIGTEILLGDITNTNAAFLARELAGLGINCFYQTSVGDNAGRLRAALAVALSRADLVITTGGLGPTQDDLTKETIASYLGLPLAFHDPSWEHVRAILASRGRAPVESQRREAMMPVGADDGLPVVKVLPNGNGTANGVWLEVRCNGMIKTLVMLPGPPREMKALFHDEVQPLLAAANGGALVSRNLRLFGIGESLVEKDLPPGLLEAANPTVALYAQDTEVRLRVSARAASEAEAEALIAPVVAQLSEQFAKYLYGIDVASLEAALVATLTAKHLTVAIAESCTGGLVAQRVTSIPGSSEVFGYGIVSYANSAKQELLGVRGSTLAQYGAVSEETAMEMAEGVKNLSGADIGLSITGIAGPGSGQAPGRGPLPVGVVAQEGGTPEKPVGLVWLGMASRNGIRAVKLQLSRGYREERNFIREFAATHALYQTLREAESLK